MASLERRAFVCETTLSFSPVLCAPGGSVPGGKLYSRAAPPEVHVDSGLCLMPAAFMPKLVAIARHVSPCATPSFCMALEMSQQTVVSVQHQWLGADVACLALTCRAIHAAKTLIISSEAPVPNEARTSLEACVALLATTGLWSTVVAFSPGLSHMTCRSWLSVP